MEESFFIGQEYMMNNRVRNRLLATVIPTFGSRNSLTYILQLGMVALASIRYVHLRTALIGDHARHPRITRWNSGRSIGLSKAPPLEFCHRFNRNFSPSTTARLYRGLSITQEFPLNEYYHLTSVIFINQPYNR